MYHMYYEYILIKAQIRTFIKINQIKFMMKMSIRRNV